MIRYSAGKLTLDLLGIDLREDNRKRIKLAQLKMRKSVNPNLIKSKTKILYGPLVALEDKLKIFFDGKKLPSYSIMENDFVLEINMTPTRYILELMYLFGESNLSEDALKKALLRQRALGKSELLNEHLDHNLESFASMALNQLFKLRAD